MVAPRHNVLKPVSALLCQIPKVAICIVVGWGGRMGVEWEGGGWEVYWRVLIAVCTMR